MSDLNFEPLIHF